MKIACLQFAPELGQVEKNIEKANSILSSTPHLQHRGDQPVWLVLPELAFSGYNFPSLEDITPFLEPTAGGVSTKWAARVAQRYRCYVTVGYPEKSTKKHPNGVDFMNFNSQVTVLPSGEVLSNYRKRFLYYTDETWASEGDKGFYYGAVDGIGCIAMGICMDINPYQFLAPWNNYEFANHVLETGAQLVIVSMAFLTRLSPQELRELPLRPDNATLEYWVERFYPVHRSNRQPVFIVFSNRCGIEGSACYAGTSSIICFREGKGYIYDLLGKWDEQCLVVDLQKDPPKFDLPTASSTKGYLGSE